MKDAGQVHSNVKFIAAEGTLDARSMPRLEAEVNGAMGKGATHVVLHLARVRRIDTCGLSMLMAVIAAVRRHGAVITIIGFNDNIDMLVAVKLLTVAEVIESEAEICACLCRNSETHIQLDTDRTAA